MNRDGLKYLVAGSLLTIFFGWVFKTIEGRPALASDLRFVSADSLNDAPQSADKSISARQFKLVDDNGDVAAILGAHANGAPYLKMLGDNGKSYLEIESRRITIVDQGVDAITIDADDGERRIYVNYGRNDSAYAFHATRDGTCATKMRGKLGSSILYSCEPDGTALTSMSAKKSKGGITFAVDPIGAPVIGLNNGAGKGALSLYCYENAPGMTIDLPNGKAQAVIGMSCEDPKDSTVPLFRALDASKTTVWKAP